MDDNRLLSVARRHQKNKLRRAWQEGEYARRIKSPRSGCPYADVATMLCGIPESEYRTQWLKGWDYRNIIAMSEVGE